MNSCAKRTMKGYAIIGNNNKQIKNIQFKWQHYKTFGPKDPYW